MTKPIEVWGNYHTQIAFYDKHNSLVYHRKGCFAHFLQVDNEFVIWSDTGEFALFYEFKRGHISKGGIYQYVLLDLIRKTSHRIDLYEHDYKFLDNLNNGFCGSEILNQIKKLGICGEPCYVDKISVSPLRWIIGIEKWKPAEKL